MADIKKEQERDELHRAIWSIADDLRGSVDGWDFKFFRSQGSSGLFRSIQVISVPKNRGFKGQNKQNSRKYDVSKNTKKSAFW